MISFSSLRRSLFLLSIASLCSFATHSAHAGSFTLGTDFDATFDDTLTGPFVGTATLSYDAPSALPDGSYDWDSFTNLSLQITMNGVTFTQSDLLTSSAPINIEIRSGYFFFTNDSANGAGNGPQGGSADFAVGSDYLTTQPITPQGVGYVGGGENNPLYMASIGGNFVGGTYGVVPEPSIGALLLFRSDRRRWF